MIGGVVRMQTMLDRADQLKEQLITWRREIHKHPELGFQETQTAALVSEVLQSLNYRVRKAVGRTGVVGERGEGKPLIALRFDMDALPIQEENDVPYASQVPGVMHACGHDAHTAIGMGIATLMAEQPIDGTVRLIFQPSEEGEDEEGFSGAYRMMQDGVMEGVEGVLALHVDPDFAVGEIAVEAGPASAGVDTFYAQIIGRGGHGARPQEVIDPIYIAGHVILAINGIISRRLDPFSPAVISIGSIQGGKTDNVIPETVELIGTIRFMDAGVEKKIHTELEKAFKVARTLGGDYSLKIVEGYPSIQNDARMVRLLKTVGRDLLGEEHLQPQEDDMGAEDFAFFCEAAPGAMFRLGCAIEGERREVHNPRFDLDESCLPIGVAILTEAACRFLKQGIEIIHVVDSNGDG
jgi:amidohydrolase